MTKMFADKINSAINKKYIFLHKYSYLGKGAETWDSIAKDYYYNLGKRELATLEKMFSVTKKHLSNDKHNVLHLGSGNGVEIPIVVKSLGPNKINRYILVDISPQLLRIAKSYGEKYYKNIKFIGAVKDLTVKNVDKFIRRFKISSFDSNLILLIGNGALMSYPPVVDSIKNAMDTNDRFFITLEVYNEARKKEILEQYKLPSIINLFEKCLSPFGIINTNIKQYSFNYDRKTELIKVYFNIAKWVRDNNKRCAKLYVPTSKKLMVFTSYRPTVKHLRKYLIGKGFNIIGFKYFSSEHCCGILCGVR